MNLAGGSWIILAFALLAVVVVAYSYYTRTGSGIDQHGWSDRDRATGTSVGKDPSQVVSNWGRGTAGAKGRRRMTPVERRTAEAIDATAGKDRDPAWRARVGASAQLVAPVDPRRDHVIGPDDAAVTLVQYGEYECPYCKEADRAVAQIEARFGDDLRLVFRHFPQRDRHPYAFDAALAAEAAERQDRFWEMHQQLAGTKKALEPARLRELAGKAGLDLDRFDGDVADPALAARVREDVESGIAGGVNGTPTFFLNGVRYDDDFEPEELGIAIEAARDVVRRPSATPR